MSLPRHFVWGLGTASYQIEGAVSEDGRAPSIWDTFCQKPGRIADGSSGEIACNAYHKTAEDIALLRSYGVKTYRFSISWPRAIPLGGRGDPINQKGLDHYIKFADDLAKAGIQPIVTLFQWDLPESLHQRYGGPLNKDEFLADFSNYARVMFQALCPIVQVWFTFTEPSVIAIQGYNNGNFAPGRSSDRSKSEDGDSSRECWIVGHNLLLAHGATVKIYREQFKPLHSGEIGIVLCGQWAEPWDISDPKDVEAQSRYLDFSLHWFTSPIYHGKYPASMRAQLGDRLPNWSPEESALVKGSNDFFGLDYYTSVFVKHKLGGPPNPDDTLGHLEALQENSKGEPVGPEEQSPWLRPSPSGFRKLLNHIHRRYATKIYVAENGVSVKDENELPLEEALNDEFRCRFYEDHVDALVKSRIEDGVNVLIYMAWAYVDNFEWADGYPTRFGVTYVDFEDGQKRYPKKSSRVLGELFAKHTSK